MRPLGPMLLALSMSLVAGADEIYLVGGGKISGEIVERNAQRIVVEIGPGRVTLPMSRVTRTEAGRSLLYEFQERARSLKAGDEAGWVALGQWADERDLGTQARAAYQRALALDPGNAQANAGLGRVQTDGRWLSKEESMRAQGLVPYEGSWVTPAEREATRRDRSNEELAERADREAEARVREAEARARAAEAQARRAETEADAQESSGDGIPYWPYVYGGGGGSFRHHRDPACCSPSPGPRRTAPAPPSEPQRSSLHGSSEDKSHPPATPLPAPAMRH
jgi:hypothetical protein